MCKASLSAGSRLTRSLPADGDDCRGTGRRSCIWCNRPPPRAKYAPWTPRLGEPVDRAHLQSARQARQGDPSRDPVLRFARSETRHISRSHACLQARERGKQPGYKAATAATASPLYGLSDEVSAFDGVGTEAGTRHHDRPRRRVGDLLQAMTGAGPGHRVDGGALVRRWQPA